MSEWTQEIRKDLEQMKGTHRRGTGRAGGGEHIKHTQNKQKTKETKKRGGGLDKHRGFWTTTFFLRFICKKAKSIHLYRVVNFKQKDVFIGKE